MSLVEDLEALRVETLQKIENADSKNALEEIRISVLGKSGQLTKHLRNMQNIDKEKRAEVGRLLNEARGVIEASLEAGMNRAKQAEMSMKIESGKIDVTLPGRRANIGTSHVITSIIDELSDIFLGLGYTVKTGREVETDYYNFTADRKSVV